MVGRLWEEVNQRPTIAAAPSGAAGFALVLGKLQIECVYLLIADITHHER